MVDSRFPDGERHILFAIHQRWGHIRPSITIAVKLLTEAPNLTITFPVGLGLVKEISDQIIHHVTKENRRLLLNNLRIVPIGPLVEKDQNNRILLQEFRSFYTTLVSGTPYVSANGQTLSPIRPPDACFLDLIYYDIMQIIRQMTPNVPILVFSFCSTSLTLRLLLRGNVPLQVARLSEETGRAKEDILLEIYQPNKGQVMNIPGLPPMYDYETVPHLSPLMLRLLFTIGPKSYDSLQNCNGVITTSSRIYEPEGNLALEHHFSETNRPLYAIATLGLTAPVGVDQMLSPAERSAVAFLDRIMVEYGERSLLYISFGSVFWPPNLPAVWKILEIVVESNIPTLLSYDDRRVSMPQALHSLITSSDNVFSTPWAPQGLILGHKVTGWFLTHCGQNSIMEALSHGIPMIGWPIDTDQPLNAAYLSLKLNVAYELIEVRTGNGLKPLHRGITPRGTIDAVEEEFRGVLKQAWSSDGQQKREKAEELRRKLSNLWDKDGESVKELRRLIADYLA